MDFDSRCRQEHHSCHRIHERHHCWYVQRCPKLRDRTHLCLISVASCCNEAFKIMTSSAPYLNNYWMLIGTDGVYSYTFQHEKKPDCPVCGGQSMDVEIGKDWTLERLIEWLTETQKMCAFLYRGRAVGLPLRTDSPWDE